MGDAVGNDARPRRVGRAHAPPARHRPQRDLECGPTGRPTASERREANDAIDAMLHLDMLRGKAAAVTTNSIALALAWRNDRQAFDGRSLPANNALFGVPVRAETRRDWVDDVQQRLAQVEEYFGLDPRERPDFRPTLRTTAEVAAERERLHEQGVHVPHPPSRCSCRRRRPRAAARR
jgi:hypothetical protein